MKPAKSIAVVLPLFGLAAHAKVASAQSLEGAFQVGLDATVAEYVKVTLENQLPQPGPPGTAPGAQSDLSSSRTTVGLSGGGAGIRLAGGLSDTVLLGGRISVGTTSTEILSQSGSSTSVTIVPSLEFLLSTSEAVRPFVALDVGYTSLVTSPGGGSDTTASGWLGGAGLGMHGFVTPSFSIDPAVNVFYTQGSIETGGSKFDQTGVTVWLNVGISGWIRRAPENPVSGPRDETARPIEGAPGATAPAAAAPSRVSDDRGRLATSFSFDTLPTDPPGQRLRLVVSGEPRTDGDSASLLVTGLVATKQDAACATADLAIEGATIPLPDVRSSARAGFTASEFTLQMKVDIHALERLGESHGEASIGVCGVRRIITPQSRANIYEWVEQFRTKARAAGTWKEAK